MIKVDWSDIKTFVDDRALSVQYIDFGSYYHLWAYDGPMALECILPQDGTSETEFENDYKANGNKPNTTRTRSERADISMKLCRNSAATSSGVATVEFKVPGTFGTDKGREIEGGYAYFGTDAPGDYIHEINVVDKDNKLGYGAGVTIKKWHDDDVTSYQSSGIWVPKFTTIHAMGDWGSLPSGLYLQIKGTKASGEDTLYVSILWGEPS